MNDLPVSGSQPVSASDAPLRLRVGARTERGRREENQDQMTGFLCSFGAVYLVADGMGGHSGGATASRLVAEGYRRELGAMPVPLSLGKALQRATAAVNEEMLQQGSSGDQNTRGMGSTVVLVALRQTTDGPEYVIGHIGDSRAYLIAGGAIRKLTRDHSMVQRLVDEKLLTQEDAETHPEANVLIRAMGQQAEVLMDISEPRRLDRGARILLCSDGLWGYMTDEAILEEASRTHDPEQLAANLVELALKQGSDDNITVQIVCQDTSRVTSPVMLQPLENGREETVGDAVSVPVSADAVPVADPVPTSVDIPTSAGANPPTLVKVAPGRLRSWSMIVLLIVLGAGLVGSGVYLFLRSHSARPVRRLFGPAVSPVAQPRQESRSPPVQR